MDQGEDPTAQLAGVGFRGIVCSSRVRPWSKLVGLAQPESCSQEVKVPHEVDVVDWMRHWTSQIDLKSVGQVVRVAERDTMKTSDGSWAEILT